jgi:flagellar hook-associated protein 3 FlgL
MRINPNAVPDILSDLQRSQASLDTALQQVSTGKSVNAPSDNPTASAEMVQNTIETGEVDQYTKNISTVQTQVESASSALSSVITQLTKAVSLGTEGANGTSSSANRQALATEVQGILTSVVGLANTSVGGTYLFSGTGTTTPYTADSSSSTGYTYNGNNDTNSVQVGDQTSIQVNLSGSQIFSNSSSSVIGSLSSLVTALESGDSSAIETATTSVSSAISCVGQQQVFYSNASNQLTSQGQYLQQDTVTLASQEDDLIGVDEATAATNLSQAETANTAAIAAAAKVVPKSLLDYLSNPT